MLKSKQKIVYAVISAVAIGAVLLLFTYSGQRRQAEQAAPPSGTEISELDNPAQPDNQAPSELDVLLFTEQKDSIPAFAQACPRFTELRGINFQHPDLSMRLCRYQAAYTMLGQKYPPCEIGENLPSQFMKRVNKTSARSFIQSAVTGRNIAIYTYLASDKISKSVILSHSWEKKSVAFTLSIAKRFPIGSVSFLDIGCNIGVYTLQAREAEIPTVAVDENFRNLIRVRMSANDMGWQTNYDDKLKLMWMYFHKSVSLHYLKFDTALCEIDNDRPHKEILTDTIPVMTGSADELVSNLITDLVVMKIDIDAGTQIIETGQRLFKEKKIIAVKIELHHPSPSKLPSELSSISQFAAFLVTKNYTLFPIGSLDRAQDLKVVREWDGIWISNDYLSKLRMK